MKKSEIQSQIKDLQKYISSLNEKLIFGDLYTNGEGKLTYEFNNDIPFNPQGCYRSFLECHQIKEKISQSKEELEKLLNITLEFVELLTKNIIPFFYKGHLRFRYFYHSLNTHNSGKWMIFDRDAIYLKHLCESYTQLNNHNSSKLILGKDTCVACFYVKSNNYHHHIECLSYLLSSHAIPLTKNGKLTNIGFKLDEQTLNNEYGKGISKFHLNDFIDIETGEVKGKNYFKQLMRGEF